MPSLLVAAIAAAILAAVCSRPRSWWSFACSVAIGVPLGALAFAAWRASFVPAYFHQNGHGPRWIFDALNPGIGSYGRGYAEIFGAIASAGADAPDRAVFAAQSLAMATGPGIVAGMARRIGASWPLALAAALAWVADPLVARVAQSESYWATGTWLLLAASAALLVPARPRIRSAAFAFAVIASGLVVAQAARVHPALWLPSAAVPSVLLLRPGPLRPRAVAACVAALGIGLVVAVVTGRELLAVQSDLIGRSGSDRGAFFHTPQPPWELAWPVLAGLAALVSRRREPVVALVVLAGVDLYRWACDAYPAFTAPVHHAHALLFSGVLILGATASLRSIDASPRWRWLAPAAILVAAGVQLAAGHRAMRALPAHAEQARLVIGWREELPADATVFALEHAGHASAALPIYRGRSRPVVDLGDRGARDPGSVEGPRYYARTVLCEMTAGRPACDAFERAWKLEPQRTATVPAGGPLVDFEPFERPLLDVGLFRIVGPAEPR